MTDTSDRPRGGSPFATGEAAPLPLGEAEDVGDETFLVRCPFCGRTCVFGRSAGPVAEVHPPMVGRGLRKKGKPCRWIGVPDPFGDDHRYVPIPDGERHGDWVDLYRTRWEERYQVRAYLARRVNGTNG